VNGKGKQTISALVKDKELTFDLEFLDPNPMKSIAKFTFEPVEGGTKVTWSTSGESEYPVGRYFGLFLDGLIGPDFEAGLNNLKNILEKKLITKLSQRLILQKWGRALLSRSPFPDYQLTKR
jgi:hypothetical protein